ncbi:MAG: hypothetical protein HND52_07445 [Ignavibacteriae bacterium]|nr:hypothetical protein [Ignavibacteriota bacterium]NOG97779.1 hypothetical protein [Ignavibacteriota bacterium]
MKQLNSLFSFSLIALLLFTFLSACSNQDNLTDPEETQSDIAALKELADADEDLQSFEPNYNEEDAMDFIFPKTAADIYPVRVGQRMRLVSKTLDITFEGDTAYGLLTKTFEGKLFIAASFDPFDSLSTNLVDTLVVKEFSTTVTRNIIFEKVNNSASEIFNWRIIAISLPEGGTLTENIAITKLTAYLPNGDTLTITSPNDYYLQRASGRFGWFGRKFWHQFPIIRRFDEVTMVVNVQSAYEADDFVTLTYGARRNGYNRAKKRFELVSSEFDGQYYQKVYQATYTTHQHIGPYHAIINAMPKQVIYDDAAPVEVNTWGFPYFVR